jgi:hypothetical protein
MRKEPQEQRKRGAEDEAGDDRKVERGVFAAMDDIARETAETEGEFPAKVKKGANDNQQAAEEEQCAAEFTERVHPQILPETSEQPSPSTASVICFLFLLAII